MATATKEPQSDKLKDREALRAAAIPVFARKGAEATIDEIAKEAKIDLRRAKAAVPDIGELLSEIIDREVAESTDLYTKVINDRGKADVKLTRLVRELMTRYQQSPALFHILGLAMEAVSEEESLLFQLVSQDVVDRYRQATAIIGRLIAQGQTEGIFTDTDPLEAAYLLRGMIRNAIFFRRATGRTDDMRDHADVVMRVFLKGLLR